MTTRQILMELPLYLISFSAIYLAYRDYKKQAKWNAKKKWNLAGAIFFTLGLMLKIYEDFLMD
jgi:hypothetical protein